MNFKTLILSVSLSLSLGFIVGVGAKRMGDLLEELEHLLRSEGMTREEAVFFKECKDKAIEDFTVGACASSVVAWIASRSLVPCHRFSLSAESGMLAGMWRFNHSLDACVDKILQRDWDRMKFDAQEVDSINRYGTVVRRSVRPNHGRRPNFYEDYVMG
ncbi:uncharacterized protein LOC120255659 [Dioscorea cayenensis subsp. rotundata]|uniref:Uncharacterized protein LOC120255659 n=1 Tax=Dioscorea cayennensis subsp. rotundata TaxID=55577 RepID=A0AB40AWQ3_DIOCR|nr:uncharacterized protein LOC120255659 [Dioscorea cayenensis subsp. rotundata]